MRAGCKTLMQLMKKKGHASPGTMKKKRKCITPDADGVYSSVERREVVSFHATNTNS